MKDLLNSTQNKVILGLVAIIIVMVIIYFAFFSKNAEEKSLDKNLKKKNLSYPESQYFDYANTIEVATSGFTDDEDTIYSIFEKLNNIDDLYMLKKAFGNRTYFGGSIFVQEDLIFILQAVLEPSELEKVNGILATNGINYTI